MQQTNIFDVFIIFIQYGFLYGMPVIGTIFGVFVGKWIEGRNKTADLKREIYLAANVALGRYSNFYITTGAYPKLMSEKMHEETMLLEEAKSNLEIYGSDPVYNAFSETLNLAVKCGQEALDKSQKGLMLIHPDEELLMFNEYSQKHGSLINLIRKELNAK
jgi:hypothetical protein